MSSADNASDDTNFDNCSSKFRDKLSKITVEPVLLLTTVANILIKLAIQNLNLEKACRVNLEYDNIVCDALMARDVAKYTIEQENVQKIVVTMFGWKTIVQNAFPAFLILLWGSWSDRFHIRKPIILIPVFGDFLLVMGLIVCTYLNHSPLEAAIMIEAGLSAISGSSVMLCMGINSYICDITTESDRTARLGIIHITFMVGLELGNALNGVLLKLIGYYGIFSLAAVIQIAAFTYGLFLIREDPVAYGTKTLIFNFFNIKYLVNQFKTIFISSRAKKIILIIIASILVHGQSQGNIVVEYLYTRLRFNWDEIAFSAYASYIVIISILGTTLSISVFSNIFKCHDAALAMVALVMKGIACVAYTFATSSWHLYAIVIIEMFYAAAFIAIKSMISKAVGDNELAKVNSLIGMADYVAPLLFVSIYTKVYSVTLTTYPSAFFMIGVPIMCFAFYINLWLYTTRIRIVNDDDGDDDTDENQMLRLPITRTFYGSVSSSIHGFYEFNC